MQHIQFLFTLKKCPLTFPDAAKLAQKKNFNYQQTQLSIRLYTAEHPVPTVYITGLPDGCDDEMLHDILEELFHKEVPIKEFQFLPENESAMVTFENLTGMLQCIVVMLGVQKYFIRPFLCQLREISILFIYY